MARKQRPVAATDRLKVVSRCSSSSDSTYPMVRAAAEADTSAAAASGWARGRPTPRRIVLQKVPSEANPKVRNHGEGPY